MVGVNLLFHCIDLQYLFFFWLVMRIEVCNILILLNQNVCVLFYCIQPLRSFEIRLASVYCRACFVALHMGCGLKTHSLDTMNSYVCTDCEQAFFLYLAHKQNLLEKNKKESTQISWFCGICRDAKNKHTFTPLGWGSKRMPNWKEGAKYASTRKISKSNKKKTLEPRE